jgi:hypothetical protein
MLACAHVRRHPVGNPGHVMSTVPGMTRSQAADHRVTGATAWSGPLGQSRGTPGRQGASGTSQCMDMRYQPVHGHALSAGAWTCAHSRTVGQWPPVSGKDKARCAPGLLQHPGTGVAGRSPRWVPDPGKLQNTGCRATQRVCEHTAN